MVLFISFIFFILAIIGYAKERSVISPLFIMPFIWALLLLLFTAIPHSLYPLHSQFLISLSLWVSFFYIFCFLTLITDFKTENLTLYNKNIFTIYYFILIVTAPLALALLILEALKVGPEMFFLKLRMINTGLDEEETFSLGPLSYVFNFSSVLALLYTYYKERVSWSRYYTVIFFAFFLGLITLARTSLVTLSIGVFIVLYFKGKIKVRHYAYFGFIFFAFLFLVTLLRDQGDSQGAAFSDIFSQYIFGGMPAFDSVKFEDQDQFGGQTLRFFYAVMNSLGGNFEVKQTILPYTNVPELTNVYTVLQPFFKDFGYYGVAIFGAVYGIIFGTIYKFASRNDPLMGMMYAFLFPCLLLQFFGEYIFSNLSTFLQYAIILLISQRLKF